MIKIGVLSIPNIVENGIYDDKNGPLLFSLLDEWLEPCYEATCLVIPSQETDLEEKLRYLVDRCGCSLVITLGGTGPGRHDVTPEVTALVCQKILPGFGEAMRSVRVKKGIMSTILNRQTAGIYNESLVVNFPGDPEGIKDGLARVIHAMVHCLEALGHRKLIFREGKKWP